ncbi:MAG: gamma-glutamylcyclotransferase [Candidatus Thioglobus sp.]|uniref:gamma-glutamylcyclotransferase family protein n=1 Tax=Candidatus Thioglobus sp. TaxID=2026721 RepID=UPI00261A280E|nr:gamma-glutamylcyclotransferase family protein [Candidatus Thioglobus sp.]MDC9727622.1 gamma-glutamylcyclotransferase [Candidatus Thioglobus sp.]
MSNKILLFSYGTLQQTPVQIETFGRELGGSNDYLLGYSLAMVAIKDEAVVKLSGKTHHPIAVSSKSDTDEIAGVVFEISAQELAHSDKYEVDAYQRVLGQLKSGKQAWVYVSAN